MPQRSERPPHGRSPAIGGASRPSIINERCGAGPCAPAERAASPCKTTLQSAELSTSTTNERGGAGPCAPAQRAASPHKTTCNRRSLQPQPPTSDAKRGLVPRRSERPRHGRPPSTSGALRLNHRRATRSGALRPSAASGLPIQHLPAIGGASNRNHRRAMRSGPSGPAERAASPWKTTSNQRSSQPPITNERCGASQEQRGSSGAKERSGACRPTAGRPGPAMRITQRAERGRGASATGAAEERCDHSQEQRGNPGAERSGACRPTSGSVRPAMTINLRAERAFRASGAMRCKSGTTW